MAGYADIGRNIAERENLKILDEISGKNYPLPEAECLKIGMTVFSMLYNFILQ